jgi:hypothetical protein
MSAPGSLRRELAACAAIARLAWQARTNQGSNWLTWVLLALALLIPAAGFAISNDMAKSIGLGAGLPLGLLAGLWWIHLAASVAQQRVLSSKLVPAIGRRSVAVLLAGACAITLVLAPLIVLAGQAPLTAAILVVLALVIALAYLVVPALQWWLYALVCGPMIFGNRIKALLPFPVDLMIVTAGPVLIVCLGTVALRAIHAGVTSGGGMFDQIVKASKEGGANGADAAFGRRLRRDCAEGRIEELLLYAAGPLARAPSPMVYLVGGALGLAAMFALPGWVAEYHATLRAAIPGLMVAMQLIAAPAMVQAMYKGRREQALVRLAARAPDARSINAALARSLLLEYGRNWLGSTLLALVLLYFLVVPAAMLLHMLAVFLMTLAWANLLLRDYSSEGAGKGSAGSRILVLLGGCCLALAAPATFFSLVPWLVLGAGTLLAGLALAYRRWNRMLRAPAAFPAGRLR